MKKRHLIWLVVLAFSVVVSWALFIIYQRALFLFMFLVSCGLSFTYVYGLMNKIRKDS